MISGFGRGANRYRNVLADGAVEVEIARECWLPQTRALAPGEAVEVLADYERRNRLMTHTLGPLELEGPDDSRRWPREFTWSQRDWSGSGSSDAFVRRLAPEENEP